jgi:rhizosphere induced protein
VRDRRPQSVVVVAQTFVVNFYNNGPAPGTVILYQRKPEDGSSLAWFAKYNYPQTRLQFSWTTGLDFVWSDTGQLVPGIIVSASQAIPADLAAANMIQFTYDKAFHFTGESGSGRPGTLTIRTDSTIPPGMASLGIGMSGQPTFMVQAQPNMNYTFSPTPEYWIAFGSYTAGQVLDVETIGTPAQIDFPPNISSMDATLNPDGSWTVVPTHLAA